jgi:CheY-like chemotaxis protein
MDTQATGTVGPSDTEGPPRVLRVDDFLATLSHELRTPLTPLRAGLDLLKSRVDPSLLPTIEAMERNLLQETRLIDSLLDVARVTAGQLVLQRQNIDPRPCLLAALEEAAPRADAKGQALLVELPPLPAVVADPVRLQQVFAILLDNAVKFSPPRGRIHVVAHAAEGRVVVAVADSGPGIDVAFLPHLFEPFHQTDTSSRRPHGGLGLGLALAARVMTLHGGELRADNLPGSGTCFTCSLPVAEQSSAPLPAAAPRRLRILLVDDSLDTVEILGRLLAMKGMEVREAASVEQAVARLRDEVPDVIVTDIGMPNEDGYDLLRRVRADDRLRGVPVIAATGYVGCREQQRMADTGFAAALTKPFDLAELLETLERVCGSRG